MTWFRPNWLVLWVYSISSRIETSTLRRLIEQIQIYVDDVRSHVKRHPVQSSRRRHFCKRCLRSKEPRTDQVTSRCISSVRYYEHDDCDWVLKLLYSNTRSVWFYTQHQRGDEIAFIDNSFVLLLDESSFDMDVVNKRVI